MNFPTAALNHLCHKLFPYIIISFLIIGKFGLTTWEPYVIMGLIFFVDKYNYKIGYFCCLMERVSTSIIPNEKKPEMEE
tara:strand:+ start:830 stop:1066 length:237 start_codon:yes stop_codon:yes gene_type:complete